MGVLSEELKDRIRAYIPKYPRKQAVTLPALHLVHDELRTVPDEAIVEIAALLDLAPSEVKDTMTFYEFFKGEGERLGKTRLWVCRGLACMLRGAYELIEHCEAVAREIPLTGFYLQPAVGGLELDAEFWTRFAAIENVVAIKVAPFNRYRTLDVVRGIVEAGAEERIALYTGNDDHIVLDLVTPFVAMREARPVTVRFVGGLLGHWSVWTKKAIELYRRCRKAAAEGAVTADLLALDSRVTDCNSAFFDVANNFHGCIAGCHEVLRRQGLFAGTWCLDPEEGLSPGQAAEIDRVSRSYPELADDAFVAANLERWLS